MGIFSSRCSPGNDFHLLGVEERIPLDETFSDTDAKLRDAKLEDAFDFFKNERGTISRDSFKIIMKALDIDPHIMHKDIKEKLDNSNELTFSEFREMIQSVEKRMSIERELIECLRFLNRNYIPQKGTDSETKEGDEKSEFNFFTQDFIVTVLTGGEGACKLTEDELKYFQELTQISVDENRELPSKMNTPELFIKNFMRAKMDADLVD